jgi:hypothetical protein
VGLEIANMYLNYLQQLRGGMAPKNDLQQQQQQQAGASSAAAQAWSHPSTLGAVATRQQLLAMAAAHAHGTRLQQATGGLGQGIAQGVGMGRARKQQRQQRRRSQLRQHTRAVLGQQQQQQQLGEEQGQVVDVTEIIERGPDGVGNP